MCNAADDDLQVEMPDIGIYLYTINQCIQQPVMTLVPFLAVHYMR